MDNEDITDNDNPYVKTTVTFTILSQGDVIFDNVLDLAYQIRHGDCLAAYEVDATYLARDEYLDECAIIEGLDEDSADMDKEDDKEEHG